MKAKIACPDCGSSNIGNNRRVWHKNKQGVRVQTFQLRCKSCGRLFIQKE